MPIGRLFVEIAGDSSGLDKSLKAALDNVKQFDVSVKQTGQRFLASFQDMINPTNKLVDQLKLLQMAGYSNQVIWKAMGDQFQTAAAQAKKFGQDVDPAIKEFMKSAQGAGSYVKDLGQAIINFAQNPIQTMRAGITAIAERLGPLAVGFLGIGTAIAAGATAIYKFISAASDAYEQLENLSIMTGVSVNELKALRQAADEAGFEGLDLGRSLFYINQQLAETGKAGDLQKGMDALGISARDAKGNLKDALTIIDELGGAIANQADPVRQASDLAAVFGVRYRELGAFAVKLQGQIRETTKTIEESGNAYSEAGKQMLKDMDAAKDSTSRYFEALKNSWVTSLGEIWGGIKGLKDKIEGLPGWFQRFIGVSIQTQNQLPAVQPRGVEELVGPPDPGLAVRMKNIADLTKAQEEAAKKAAEAAKKAEEERQKQLIAAMELAVRLNDETKLYAGFVDAAAKVWKAEVLPTIKEVEEGAKRFDKGLEDLNQLKIHPVIQPIGEGGQSFEDIWKDAPRVIKGPLDAMEKQNKQTAENIGDIWKRQVSTIVTDWGRGISDILVEGGNFADKLTNIFKETAKSILRMLIEQLFNPLKNWLSGILGSLFGMGKGGAAGTATAGGIGGLAAFGGPAGLAIGGGLAGVMIPQATSGKVLGGIAGGLAGTAVAGGMTGLAAGAGIGGFGLGAASILAAIPVWGWAALGATAIGTILYKVFTKNAFEAAAKEVANDLGNLNVGQNAIKSFFSGVGLTEKQAYPIRKDLLFSPAFISQIAVPAAQSQGRLEALLKSLEKVTVDTDIATSGYLNFRSVVEQGIKTGNWDAFNKAYIAAFQNSKALVGIMPDFASVLAATGTAMSDVADATDEATTGFTGLRDAILASMPAAKDMFQTFWDTGEILPELADLITKFGGNLAIFQKAGDFGQLRANLAGISELIAGLGNILPELSPIEKLLSGGGIDWTGLQALNIDPSKLIPIADLITLETRWEDSVKQFQDTGKLMSGSALQQGLWKFGGTAGATALSRWDQGFNTITPGLLDMTKSAMDAAYAAERQTAMDYLTGIQSTMESEIQTASDAIVAELEKILAAIESGKTATAATTPESVAAQGGAYIDLRGATVYGYEDFETKVQTAWNTAYRRGAFGYAVP